MLYFSYKNIVVEEVPDEISLSLSISGCPLRCYKCHSQETYDKKFGEPLTPVKLREMILQSKYISCVLFYGGEWEEEYLMMLLAIVKKMNLKTCLYTGKLLEDIPDDIKKLLNYIKVGAYNHELGGLSSSKTNQQFFNLDTNKELTYIFHKD